jgi:heat shock protein HslJ
MRMRRLILVLTLAFAACTPGPSPATKAPETRNTAELLNTYWKLTQVGDQVITTPEGAREIHLVLHSENQRVSGFSGCNNMMGGYVLEGDALRFAQMGGTMMACVDTGMELEKKFLSVFPQVAHWEIRGETLTLSDADRKRLAIFESRYMGNTAN